jgi:urease accessory protein
MPTNIGDQRCAVKYIIPLAGEGVPPSIARRAALSGKTHGRQAAQRTPSPASGGGLGWGLPEAGVQGVAEVGFAVRDGATRLAHLYQRHPLRVLFPDATADDVPVAVLVTTSGGLVAGDRLRVEIRADRGAAAHLTASAAEKIYRSTGATTEIAQTLSVDAGGWLEFLPPETILFDGARLRRETVLTLAAGAGFLGGGILVFGRRARGEHFTRGFLHEAWRVQRDGKLIWGDALHLDEHHGGDIAAIMADPACFAGAAACATLVLAPVEGDPRPLVDAAREVQQRNVGPELRAGITAVNGLLVARWLGDPLLLRRGYADLACHLREAAMGLPPRLPRLWDV